MVSDAKKKKAASKKAGNKVHHSFKTAPGMTELRIRSS